MPYGLVVFDLENPAATCKLRSTSGLSQLDLYFWLLVHYLEDEDVLKGCHANECTLYDKEKDIWKPDFSHEMPYRTNFATASLPNGKLWITGGSAQDGIVATTFIMNADGSYTPSFSLPQSASSHCIVVVDDSTAILATGYPNIGYNIYSRVSTYK